ncbi:MAG: FG-GAP-like repeat-containing protein [Flavobacteriales bacterium]|nr:FG-GAP-like repeat-containing protein [Flavobacteriales bacterium]
MKSTITLVLLVITSVMMRAQQSCETAVQAYSGLNNGIEMVAMNGPAPTNCMFLNGDEHFTWYYFIAPEDTGYVITSDLEMNVGLDTRIGVYSGECGSLTCVGFDDDSGAGYLSTVTITAEAGEVYFIVFDDYWGGAAVATPLMFDISEVEPQAPVGNVITFVTTPITGLTGSECIVDMNGDFLDDVVSTSGDQLTIFYQQEDGTFLNQTYNAGPVMNTPSWSIAAGDLDNNGYNDLLYGGGGGASFIWANEDGTGYHETHDDNYIFSQRTNMVDINNDGLLDGFVCHDIDANVFYINNGDGTMTHNQGGLGEWGGNYGSVWIDYDNDCDMDMFIAKCGSDNIDQLHRNNGDGTFTSVGAEAGIADPTQSWSSAWADYDNDGDMDVFIGASSMGSGGHKLYENNGDGTFTNITEGSGFDAQDGVNIENMPGDFNNDGWVDVLGAGSMFMINNGDMTFSPSICPFYLGPCGDLNNDGYLDFISGSTAYINNLEGNNYITINTVGTESNKNGIGARITVTSALGNQIRDVRSAEAFSPMQSLNAHFGLGTDTEIEVIRVCWPSGIEDVIYNPEINTALTIVEGSSPSKVEESAKTGFVVYPNPANDHIRIDSELGLNNSDVVIYDMTGKLVQSGKLNLLTYDVSELSRGMYVVAIQKNGETFRTTFSKQ